MNYSSVKDDELILSYLDRELDPDGIQELKIRLKRPGFQLRLAQFSVDTAGLYEIGSQNGLRVLDTLPRIPVVSPRTWLLPAAAAAVFVLMVSAWLTAVVMLRPEPLITMTEVKGTVFAEKISDPIQTGAQLPSGAALTSIEPGTSFAFFNGTTAVLGAQTQVRIEQKEKILIFLKQGKITLSVTHGVPLEVSTPLSTVAVTGTEFSVERRGTYDAVKVREGSVQVERIADEKTVTLEKGSRIAVSVKDAPLERKPLFKTYQLAEIDFSENGADSFRGEFVTQGLPEGSKKGLKTARESDPDKENIMYSLGGSSWRRGFFSFTEKAVLHVRYKAEKFGYFHLMLTLRTGQLPGDFAANLFYQDFWKRNRPGEWIVADIPLDSYKGKYDPEEFSSFEGCVVYGFGLFSWTKDMNLTVDRIWVTYTEELDFD